jgi:cyclopropane-fatty-acyl-phospholipid synthase
VGSQKDVAFTYDDLDELWRLSLGEHADITAAFYDGDYRKSLEQAQADKHEWILKGLGFQPGFRVLDIGCGWGPMLKAIQDRRGTALGLTLSPSQLAVCERHHLEALLLDWKTLRPGQIGAFDALVSVGAFEHFCSEEEYLAGQRDDIYRSFFRTCAGLLKDGGRLFLQTMTWGSRLPWRDADPTEADLRKVCLDAPPKSDSRVLASVKAFFPGCWLPKNLNHLTSLASEYFGLESSSDGRLDYIQTLTEWEKAWWAPGPRKFLSRLKQLPRFVFGGSAYRAKMRCLKENHIREVFIRDLFGHQRMFFKKK